MRFNKQDLLTLLISLFILSGCENPDSVGLEVDPDNAINGQSVDTVTVTSATVAEDSILTNNLSNYPLSYFKDPIFGVTEANIALLPSLPSATFTPPTAAVLDSAVLVLKFGKEFYGDSLNSVYSVNVHQLNEKFNTATRYFNTKTWNFNSAVIGNKTVPYFAWRDSVTITQIVKAKADSVKKVVPQLRIRINPQFINPNFLSANADNFKDNAAFQTFIKGLYVTIGKTQSSGAGGTVFFSLAGENASQLELYYKTQSAGVADTTLTSFPVTAAAANIKHNYTGTAVETQLNNPNQQYNVTYLQPMAGVRTKVNFPFLNKLKDLGNIIINKAELIITVASGTDVPFAPAPRLTLYRTDIAGQRQPVPDGDIGQTTQGQFDPNKSLGPLFGGNYNRLNKQYTFILTSYIQDILNDKLKQYDIYIAPMDAREVNNVAIFPSGTTAARAVINGDMKLNIIYTTVN